MHLLLCVMRSQSSSSPWSTACSPPALDADTTWDQAGEGCLWFFSPCAAEGEHRHWQTLGFCFFFLPSEIFLTIFFARQERSPTNARCVGKPSARAPTSSPTAASTPASNPSAVSSVPRASNARWTYGGTGRPNTV